MNDPADLGFGNLLAPEVEVMATPESIARDVYAIVAQRLRLLRLGQVADKPVSDAAMLRQLVLAAQAAQQMEIMAKKFDGDGALTDEEFHEVVGATLRLVRR